jgi:hypothetical protein
MAQESMCEEQAEKQEALDKWELAVCYIRE